MCGIPMTPPSEALTGKKLTFEQAMAHVGGENNFITATGRELIRANTKEYIWKYPDGRCFCTACGQEVATVTARHNADVSCPSCRQAATLKHEARGHGRVFDAFCLYEWRKSALDPQTLCVTATWVCRDSTHHNPEAAPLSIDPAGLYIFRPGRATTVYKAYRAYSGVVCWSRVDSGDVTPVHSYNDDIVEDYGSFVEALKGTRTGAIYWSLRDERGDLRDPDIQAVANAARRPYLEYLHKCGQTHLAGELLRTRTAPRDVITHMRAKNPRELLGLTEGQWYQVRRDGLSLSIDTLRCVGMLRRMGITDLPMSEVVKLRTTQLEIIAPPLRRPQYDWQQTVWSHLEHTPEKLRRKAVRRILRENGTATEWRDYYKALRDLGEDMTNPALILPKDMHAMHDRMTQRLNDLREAERQREDERKRAGFMKWLDRLKPRYTFSACGLTMRPFESGRELVDEGRTLNICIGGYVNAYINNCAKILCALRRAEEPDEPWRAVEFSTATGAVVQDRGFGNDRNGIPPGDARQIRAFWTAWNKRRKKTA